MANASAKRSAAARQATESFYRPLLLLINLAYLALVYYCLRASSDATTSTGLSWVSIAATCAIWFVQYLCYQTILDDAALNRGGSSASASSASPLAGGVALDLLAGVVVVQFAGIAWSPRAYWGLLLIPLGMAWQLYKTIRGSLPSAFMPASTTSTHHHLRLSVLRRKQQRAHDEATATSGDKHRTDGRRHYCIASRKRSSVPSLACERQRACGRRLHGTESS